MKHQSYQVPMNPLELVTSKFTPEEILFNQDGFVIASGTYEGIKNAVACRWHALQGVGYPNGFGRPQWLRMGNFKPSDVTFKGSAKRSHYSAILREIANVID